MKTLLLMRHGKSSWKDSSLSDHERPLKKRGRKDSQTMAMVIEENDLIPDLILSSTATRAMQTAEIIAETLDLEDRIVTFDFLYMGEPHDFVEALRRLGDDVEVAMIVAHNPGLEAYLQIIDGEIEALPTAGLGQLVLAIDDWASLDFETMGELVGFWTPKGLAEQKK